MVGSEGSFLIFQSFWLGVDKFETQRYKGAKDWFLKEIEERLRERAGNPPLKDEYTYHEKVNSTEVRWEWYWGSFLRRGVKSEGGLLYWEKYRIWRDRF